MRKIALVGTASSSVHAPFDDPLWEIWTVSSRGAHVTRSNRHYEMHRLDGEPPGWAASWRATLKAFMTDIPELVMMYPEPDLAPGKVRTYPHQRMCDRFGTFFMTSTFSWMMAEAIDELAPPGKFAEPGSEIAIFGVDMEYGTEYRQQRAGLRHFVQAADLLGIAVTRLATGGLSYEPVPYPMWQDDPLMQKVTLRKRDTDERLKQFDESLKMTRTMIAQNNAVRGMIEQSLADGWDPQQRLRELDREYKGLMKTSAKISEDLVHQQGLQEEQAWLLDYLQP